MLEIKTHTDARLIALMLGRLGMDVDTCIQKYLKLSSAAFRLKRSKVDILGRAQDLVQISGAYRSSCLVDEFKNAARECEGDEETKLVHDDTSCRV